jgi:hypothetical protein
MEASRAQDWTRWALVAGTFAAFALALAPLQIFTGSSDPSFYLAYANDYRAVAARFGQTYHGNRLAYVLIDAAAFHVFGPRTGYFVARWAALTVVALTLGMVARRRAGREVALLVVGLVVLLPWLTRQFLWTQYEGFSVAYVAIAAGVAVLRPRSWPWMLLAGSALSLAVNTNLTVLFVAVSFSMAWLVAQRSAGTRRLLVLSAALGAGFVTGQSVLSLVLHALVGSGPRYVEQVALEVAFRLAGDDTWFMPMSDAIRNSPYLLAVIGLVAVLAVRYAGGGRSGGGDEATRSLTEFALIWSSLLASVVLVLHSQFQHGWLGGPFYNVHFFVPTLVVVIALLALPVNAARPAASVGKAFPWTTIALIVLLAIAWVSVSRPSGTALWVSGSALVWLLGSSLRRPGQSGERSRPRDAAPLLVAATLLSLWASPSQVPTADGFSSMSVRNAFEWDVFDHQLAVQRIVEASSGPEERLMFWHTTVMPQGDWMTRINMVYYGTGQGRLHDKRDPVGMPNLPFDISGELLDVRPLNLVLISPDTFEVEAGLLALRSRGLDPRVVHQETLEGEVLDLQVLLVRLD